MNRMFTSRFGVSMITLAVILSGGCAAYQGVARPVPKLSLLSPDLSDQNREKALNTKIKLKFPVVLAIAKVRKPCSDFVYSGQPNDFFALETIQGEEKNGWLNLIDQPEAYQRQLIAQVQIISPSLLTGNPSIKKLRNAAAMLHAPLLLVYMQEDNFDTGYNAVGCFSAAQAVIIDTSSGAIVATSDNAAKREQKVAFFVSDAVKQKVQEEAENQTVTGLQRNVRRALIELARSNRN